MASPQTSIEEEPMETTASPAAEAVRQIATAGGEPAWLADWRHRAWDAFQATPMPDRVVHLWRYTEPEKFELDRVTPVVPEPGDGPELESATVTEDEPAGELVVEDGVVRNRWLDEQWREAGVVLADFRTALESHEELVREHLGSIIGPEHGRYEAANAALFAGGTLLYVPRNVYVDVPLHVTVRGTRDLSALFPRLLVVVDDGAEATVIDEYVNPAVPGQKAPRMIANSVVEGTVGQNARLSYFNIQRWGDRTRSHARQRFHVGRDAAVTTVNIGLGGQYNKADISNVQVGENAGAEMVGVIFGNERQHFDNHTEHVHRVGNSFSDMDFKVVLEDEARSAYTGLIRIDLEARNSEAYQENRNLMLDPTCKADSIPELEILNEDVRCTHGATVGPIDEEQVYYLRTRGLSEREAERLIVEGFFGPALDRIEEDALRERLWGYIDAKLASRG